MQNLFTVCHTVCAQRLSGTGTGVRLSDYLKPAAAYIAGLFGGGSEEIFGTPVLRPLRKRG